MVSEICAQTGGIAPTLIECTPDHDTSMGLGLLFPASESWSAGSHYHNGPNHRVLRHRQQKELLLICNRTGHGTCAVPTSLSPSLHPRVKLGRWGRVTYYAVRLTTGTPNDGGVFGLTEKGGNGNRDRNCGSGQVSRKGLRVLDEKSGSDDVVVVFVAFGVE